MLDHGTDNIFVAELGELADAFRVIQRGQLAQRFWFCGRRSFPRMANGSGLGLGQVVAVLPLGINLRPFLLREQVVLGRDAVVFRSTHLMFGEIVPSLLPVVHELVDSRSVTDFWNVGLRKNGKVRVA